MKNKLAVWLVVLALVVVPARILSAQEGPEGGETEEVELWEGGPGPAHAGMEMKRKGPGGKPGAKGMSWTEGEPGEGRMTVKVRKIMAGGMGGMGMKSHAFISEEDTLALIKKHDPAFSKKVEDFKTTAPAKYRMIIQLSGKTLAAAKIEEDAAVEKDAVRMIALEFEVKEQARKLDKASDAEKTAIKESLKGTLSEIFDLKSKAQELRVKRMDTSLVKLKAKLAARKANKTKIVEQRVEELTGEGYGW